MTFRVVGVHREMFRGEVRVATHHLLRFPTTELLEREERRPALHVPARPKSAPLAVEAVVFADVATCSYNVLYE